MTRIIAATALAALLAACAGQKNLAPQPDNVTIQKSYIPVAVACSANTGAEPAFADTSAAIKGAANIFERAKLYAAGRQQRIARDASLNAGNTGCAPSR